MYQNWVCMINSNTYVHVDMNQKYTKTQYFSMKISEKKEKIVTRNLSKSELVTRSGLGARSIWTVTLLSTEGVATVRFMIFFKISLLVGCVALIDKTRKMKVLMDQFWCFFEVIVRIASEHSSEVLRSIEYFRNARKALIRLLGWYLKFMAGWSGFVENRFVLASENLE